LARHADWRIAILVRARSHARDIAGSLRTRGIAFGAVDIEPLQDRPVVRDLVMLIGALLHLGDRTAWLAILRAPWAGLSLADLLIIARSAVIWESLSDDAVLALLSDDGRMRCGRFRWTLETAFRVRSQGPVARWVEQTWLALGGPSCATGTQDFDHAGAVFARLSELEERGLPDSADLVASFADLFAQQGVPSAVEIMTIHKAKGLEFDMVVVPALDRYIPRNRDQLLLSHQFARAGRDGMVLAARPGVGEEADELFEFLRYQTRDAAGLEAERLLYVACTRAKCRLVLTATIGRREETEETLGEAGAITPWKPRVGSLLAVLWPVVGAEFAPDPISSPSDQAPETAPRGGPLRRVPRDWSPTMGEPIVAAADLASAVPRQETPIFDWAGETARRVGSLVHAELQGIDLDRSDEAAIRGKAPLYRRWLSLHGVPADRLTEGSARVVSALVEVHRDERARWILQKRPRDDVREHALSGQWGGQVVRVIFDRSFVDEQGVRWVIDYKTSQHTGGNLEEFLDREVERYRPQLQRYAQLARKLGPQRVRVGLYFPLMRAWREWEPEQAPAGGQASFDYT
jgi:ATP-dependent helicase/nuclease subunit A